MTSDFYISIYELVKLIPKGKVCTYGLIAKNLGSPQASRVVGYAMNHSHTYDPTIPAHRVVNRNGQLTGKHHFATETLMQELLEAEGHTIIDDQLINFKRILWDPSEIIKY
jgi:methylated-DNA-protein-cysteine methyltransferase-like protein